MKDITNRRFYLNLEKAVRIVSFRINILMECRFSTLLYIKNETLNIKDDLRCALSST
ncbi:hypothetical protein A3Q56_02917 [Intoshia linei]|uniref:Uncharacterized protein n=1 Tax=Intoshia linei TaxID=1819745 RepID=A0A177B4V4_9BILA|nr:hypothetical protein A3Q56_02917 [Intoshia linei]